MYRTFVLSNAQIVGHVENNGFQWFRNPKCDWKGEAVTFQPSYSRNNHDKLNIKPFNTI